MHKALISYGLTMLAATGSMSCAGLSAPSDLGQTRDEAPLHSESENPRVLCRASEGSSVRDPSRHLKAVLFAPTDEALQRLVAELPDVAVVNVGGDSRWPSMVTASGIGHLSKLSRLVELRVRNAPLLRVSDIEQLSGSTSLRLLDLGCDRDWPLSWQPEAKGLSDRALEVLWRVSDLNLDWRSDVTAEVISAVRQSQNLRQLSIRHCSRLTYADVLSALSTASLDSVDVGFSGTGVEGLDVVSSGAFRLKTLGLAGHAVTVGTEVPQNSGTTRLSRLDLSWCPDPLPLLRRLCEEQVVLDRLSLGGCSGQHVQQLLPCLQQLVPSLLSLELVGRPFDLLQGLSDGAAGRMQLELQLDEDDLSIGSLGALPAGTIREVIARFPSIALLVRLGSSPDWNRIAEVTEAPNVSSLQIVGTWIGCSWQAWNPPAGLRLLACVRDWKRRWEPPPSIVLEALPKLVRLERLRIDFGNDSDNHACWSRLCNSDASRNIVELSVRIRVTGTGVLGGLRAFEAVEDLEVDLYGATSPEAPMLLFGGAAGALRELKCLRAIALRFPRGQLLPRDEFEACEMWRASLATVIEVEGLRLSRDLWEALCASPRVTAVRIVSGSNQSPLIEVADAIGHLRLLVLRAVANMRESDLDALRRRLPSTTIIVE